MEFKIGDKVRVKVSCSGAIAGEIYELTYGDANGANNDELWAWKGGRLSMQGNSGCHCQDNWELITSKQNMNKLTSKLKRLFNPSLAKQYKAGLIDDCGNLTSQGQEELNELIRDFFDKQLVEKAEEIIKEEKENK